MPDKLSSEILKIELSEATFKGTNTVVEPTYVNFFFGGNGTGKSTIAKTIQSGSGVTYKAGKAHADYLLLVYNQEFINANVRSYHDLGGVFTINDINVQIQKLIDQKTEEYAAAKKTSYETARLRDEKKSKRDELLRQLNTNCFNKSKDLRDRFIKTQKRRMKAESFTKEVRSHIAFEYNLEKLTLMYDAAYSDTAKKYGRFPTVINVSVLDNIEGSGILNVVIANAAQTEFASFLKEIGATEWFRQSHDAFYGKTQGRCPYCSRKLADDFEKKAAESFDEKYCENLKKLDDFLTAYRNSANELLTQLTQIPNEIHPAINTRQYHDKLNAIKAAINRNIDLIMAKKAEPSRIIVLEKTAAMLRDLADIAKSYNELIDDNNRIIDAREIKREKCREHVFEHMAFVLHDIIEAYERDDAVLKEEYDKLQAAVMEKDKLAAELQAEIGNLRSQTVETETAIQNINIMLHDAGFQGFEVRPRKEQADMGKPINYEVIRTETGDIASDLSEGEKNFLAFLYFQQKVLGSEKAEGDTRPKIVVIDDPVSSMDGNALFIIGEQIRKMVEVCRNNADNRNATVNGNFIKQIFILTHNAYFHREITYPHAGRYDFVSFYLVKKQKNNSSIILSRKRNPDCPSEWINVNPVKNSYAALWEEFKELKDGTNIIPIMNVIRRILEYYFLQLCGYDGSYLQKTILEDNKSAFTHDEDKNDDYTKFNMAVSMLQYISANAYGINDGFQYVNDVVDIQKCKKTFKDIFHYMGQEQHYNMMMGIK